MKIHLGTDHAGFEAKEEVKNYLTQSGHEVIDHGDSRLDPDDDYPDFVHPVAEAISASPDEYGIIFGGNGQGEAIVANRHANVRAIVFYGVSIPKAAVDASGSVSYDPYEIIRLGRRHDNANVLSIGARFVTRDEIKEAIRFFLDVQFMGEERHIRRITKIEINKN